MSRTLTVNFTALNPPPANGYRVLYRPAGSAGAYEERIVSNNSVTLTGLTANAYEGTVEAACAVGVYSTAQPFSAVVPMVCGSTRTETYSGTTGYIFPLIPLTLTNAVNGTAITIGYNVGVRPNKFTVRNITDNSVVSSTGWIGNAGYSGPWGSSLSSGSLTGNMPSFNYDNTKSYALEIECGPANLASFENDTVSVTVTCGASVTTTTTTSTTSTTTTSGPTTQYFRIRRCDLSPSTFFYTNTPLTSSGQRVLSGSGIYYFWDTITLNSSTPPANFIGPVTLVSGPCQ